VAVAIQTAAHLLDTLALGGRYAVLDATSATGLGASATLAVGCVGAVATLTTLRTRPSHPRVVAQTTLAAILAFLSVDRVIGLHDRLGHAIADTLAMPHVDAFPTPIVYSPLLLTAALMIWHETADRPARDWARTGIALLGFALGVRPLALAAKVGLGWTPVGTGHELAVAVQEGLELGGWILVGTALVVMSLARPPVQ
jgi:hypothetical protein